MSDDRAHTVKEVAQYLKISTQMVHNLLKKGELKGFKIGSAVRILHSDVLEFVNRQKELFFSENDNFINEDDSKFIVHKLNADIGSFHLRNISLELPKGKTLSIIGKSGSGKTSLLRVIAGLKKEISGSVFYGTKDFNSLAAKERKVGFVFENYALFPNMNAKKNIRFPMDVLHMKDVKKEKVVKQVAEEMNIESRYLLNKIKELPAGMKQLVAIAREKVRDVDILLLDEPLTQLDQHIKDKMKVYLKRLIQSNELTCILSINDPDIAFSFGDYVGVMDQGKLVQIGERSEVYNNPKNPTVMEITTNFPVNSIDVEVEKGYIGELGYKADVSDGGYKMMFRSNEISVEKDGIKAEVISRNFFDVNHESLICKVHDHEVIIIAPTGTPDEFSFIPTNVQYY